MNIALIGYGKMGHAIEQIATKRGHTIVHKFTAADKDAINTNNLKKADVAIEFTHPESASENIMKCVAAGVPVISGTTGWNKYLPEIEQMVQKGNGTLLHASNFSIGVNIFFEINKMLATIMNSHPDYDVVIQETHHTQKKDAPSGTAITLAEQVLHEVKRKHNWALNDLNNPKSLAIFSHRVDNIPGTHKVSYSSPIDDIEISHTAHNRDGFALGAVLAAEFIKGKKGIFSMKDVLGLK